MKRLSMIEGTLGVTMLVVAMGCSAAGSASKLRPSANVPLMQRLMAAEQADRINSQLYTWSAPGLDHYYSHKADEVADVINRLRHGEDVSREDINHALDNSMAWTFGVPVY